MSSSDGGPNPLAINAAEMAEEVNLDQGDFLEFQDNGSNFDLNVATQLDAITEKDYNNFLNSQDDGHLGSEANELSH